MSAIAGAATQAFLAVWLLVSIRVGVALAAMPAPFGALAPARLRVALAIVLALALVLPLAPGLAPAALDPGQLAVAAIGEMIVGAAIGLTVRVTLAVAEIAGSLIGQSIGLGFAGSVDPAFGEDEPPTASLLATLGVLVFLAFQGHHVVLAALAGTLRAAPAGQALRLAAQPGFLSLGAAMMARGLQVAAPVVATMFVVQLGTALASRAAPRVHIFSLSFAIAVTAGLVTLFAAAPSVLGALVVEVRRLPDVLAAAFGGP